MKKVKSSLKISDIQPIHPFPARMAPSIVWENMPSNGNSLRVLDPMAGSGTTLVSVRAMGHQAIGCDTDPLALLIARSWCSDFNPERLTYRAEMVLERAMRVRENLPSDQAYPSNIDLETQEFLNYWFDETGRCQLTALARCISRVHDPNERTLLWCAFSRLIITKKSGVSLAMDISHSRPHKKYDIAPSEPFEKYLQAVDYIARKSPFSHDDIKAPPAILGYADARELPFDANSIDMVITSPPYLNAIDYIRGHKFSLVWMGHTIASLRSLRSDNIGAERSSNLENIIQFRAILKQMVDITKLDKRHISMIIRYIKDMNYVMSECKRVLKKKGQAVFVIGDSTINGAFVKNSECLTLLAKKNGLKLSSRVTRPILENRRYLPPPSNETSGDQLQSRMKEEVLLNFIRLN